jgi:hypothetical protein
MDELLVHISAPVTRKNDDIYRFLANAYLDFEAYQPNAIDSHNASNEQQRSSCNQPTSGDEAGDSLEAPNSITSKDLYGSFPSQVSSESLRQTQYGSIIHESADSTDDSPMGTSHLGQLELIQSIWKREQQSRLSGSRNSVTDPIVETFIEDTQLAACAVHSQLLDNTSTSQDISEDEMDNSVPHINGAITHSPSQNHANCPVVSPELFALQHTTNSAAEVDLVGTFSPKLRPAKLFRATPNSHQIPLKDVSQNPNAGISAVEGSTTYSTPLTTLRSPQETGSVAVSSCIPNTWSSESHADTIDFNAIPLEMLPPGPKTSTNAPGTLPSQMTQYLKVIKKQNRCRFAPSRRARPLEPDERGYWLVETATWTPKLQYDFWSLLCDHVRKGNFGWGVFLYRDPQSPMNGELRGARGIGQVRLYCWGEITEEIWLALWLCSNGKISVSGSRWMDAGDNIVMQVP